MIRFATADDNLMAILPPVYAPFFWNSQQVLVYELDGKVVGCVILWDGQHDILRADCLTVHPAYQHHGIGIKLAHAVYEYAQQHGRTLIVFNVTNVEVAYAMQKLGGFSGGSVNIMWFPVTDRSPLERAPKEAVHG